MNLDYPSFIVCENISKRINNDKHYGINQGIRCSCSTVALI